MSAEPITDDEPDEPGGDCSPYVQLCRCFRAHADDLGLKAPDRHALLELVLAADYRTAVISSITWDDIASMLGYSRPTAQERLGALASAGAIRYRFPRGHPGFVAVLCYLDVVRVASASRADHIAEALRKEVAKADRADERAAAKIAAATKASNGATNPTAGTSNEESLPSGARIFRSDDTTPLPKGSPEPPGESMGAEGQISPRPPFCFYRGSREAEPSDNFRRSERGNAIGSRTRVRHSAVRGATVSERACARCDEELASLTAYWGDPLCSSCAQQLADLFDEQDKWPPVPWEPSEVALLDSSDPP